MRNPGKFPSIFQFGINVGFVSQLNVLPGISQIPKEIIIKQEAAHAFQMIPGLIAIWYFLLYALALLACAMELTLEMSLLCADIVQSVQFTFQSLHSLYSVQSFPKRKPNRESLSIYIVLCFIYLRNTCGIWKHILKIIFVRYIFLIFG